MAFFLRFQLGINQRYRYLHNRVSRIGRTAHQGLYKSAIHEQGEPVTYVLGMLSVVREALAQYSG